MHSYLFQQLLNGIQLGSIYALIALGYTMVYGIMKLINFAHADIFMVGSYLAFFVTSYYVGASAVLPAWIWVWLSLLTGYLLMDLLVPKIHFLQTFFLGLKMRIDGQTLWHNKIFLIMVRSLLYTLAIVLMSVIAFPVLYYPSRFLFKLPLGIFFFPAVMAYVMVLCGILGAAMEKIAYRPLRYRPRLSALITALGVSLFLENFCSLDIVFTNKYRAFPELVKKFSLFQVPSLGIFITNIFIINITVLALMLAGLWFLVEKTLIGKQMRAVAFDKRAASLMGIDVDHIISITFVIGPALAGVSGILYAANYGILQSPFLGFFPGIKAFIAAVLGGIGSLPGAVLGAFIMGISEVFANSIDSNLGFAAAFVILIVILLIKPTGILGKSDIEKV